MRNNPNLLIISPTCGTYGGIEAFTAAIAEEVIASQQFEVRIVFRLRKGYPLTKNFAEGLAQHKIPWRLMEKPDLQYAKDLLWADIVNPHFPLLYATYPALLLRKKLVVTVENKRNVMHGKRYTFGLKNADARWYISAFVAKTWGDDLSDGKSKIVPAVSELPNHWIAPEQRRGFIFIARWVPEKGLEQLIAAYSQAAIDHSAHPLTLLGNGPLRDEIEKLIAASPVRDFIHCPGFVTPGEKAHLMASARWNVAPQTFAEDLGLSPIEARSCGVPSIVSEAGGLPEAAGEAALLVPPGDIPALRAALENAATISEEEYVVRSEQSRASLEDYLPKNGFYVSALHEIHHS